MSELQQHEVWMRETKRLGAAVSKLSIVICYPTIAKYP